MVFVLQDLGCTFQALGCKFQDLGCTLQDVQYKMSQQRKTFY